MRQKRILVCPMEAVGHVNACMGAMLPLLERGHRVGFFIERSFRGKLVQHGFEEFEYRSWMNRGAENPGDDLAQMLIDSCIIGPVDIETQCQTIFQSPIGHDFRETDQVLREVIDSFQPNLFVVDNLKLLPAIGHSDRPWIKLISANPLFFLDDLEWMPPPWTGFGPEQHRDRWPMFKEWARKVIYCTKMNDAMEEMGYARYPDDRCMPHTQTLTVYGMPEEYVYEEIPKHKPEWFNLDVFNKNVAKETIQLETFLPGDFFADQLDGKFSGKWIYLSLGSMGSIDLDLMRRLVRVLAGTRHKYIVSKGPRHQEYSLARNMWGDRYLPQTKIVPLMDAVVTHGGNNTVTETFAQAVPMVVMPLFADQHDNAQRLHQMGLAVRVRPYQFRDEELVEAIDRLVQPDSQLKQRLLRASERIRVSEKHEILCDKIESIMNKVNGQTE